LCGTLNLEEDVMNVEQASHLTRREVLQATTASLVLGGAASAADEPKQFNLWAFGDAHVGTDLKKNRESLADALRQSEANFTWNIALNVGDLSGGVHQSPDDAEGEAMLKQFAVLKKHKREAIYDIAGNHDRNAVGEPEASWFRKWVDPTGENTKTSRVDPKERPYPITGTWERYTIRVGNLLFLMMSDRNEPTQKIGRGKLGGNPGGVVTGETFAWWRDLVEANPKSIILSAHHYVLKNTTVASGEWEGMTKKPDGTWSGNYHGYFEQGTPIGASYLYWGDSKPDAQLFEKYLADHPAATALWFGGHTHTNPDDAYGKKSHIETKWGTHFLNVSALTAHHGRNSVPMSRLLTFTEGSDEVRVRCWMHTKQFAPQGWYARAERVLKLPRAFQMG